MKAKIISNILISDKFGYMELECPTIAAEKTAGRFFMVSVSSSEQSLDPILKRPFAICDIVSDKVFSFLYMIVGRGTKLLTNCKEGEYLDIVGPIGNFFRLEKNANVALVAGGIGIAPMVITAKRLKECGSNVTLFYGGRSEKDLIIRDKLESVCDSVVYTTEDGSFGEKGFVTSAFQEKVTEYKKVYACGPNRMLMAVNSICDENNINIEVSLDEHMACGIGACLGCVIPIIENNKKITKRCCVEGPIFNGSKVDWQGLCRG